MEDGGLNPNDGPDAAMAMGSFAGDDKPRTRRRSWRAWAAAPSDATQLPPALCSSSLARDSKQAWSGSVVLYCGAIFRPF